MSAPTSADAMASLQHSHRVLAAISAARRHYPRPIAKALEDALRVGIDFPFLGAGGLEHNALVAALLDDSKERAA